MEGPEFETFVLGQIAQQYLPNCGKEEDLRTLVIEIKKERVSYGPTHRELKVDGAIGDFAEPL